MVYVGVDLHRKRSHVVALSDEGDVLLTKRIDSRPDDMLRVFGELDPQPIEVAFEATFGWSWFADLLADAGIPAHMAHPLATKAISSARVKTDSVDAKTLAHLLRFEPAPGSLDRAAGGQGGQTSRQGPHLAAAAADPPHVSGPCPARRARRTARGERHL
jgi:hypothetical protein